MRRHCGNEARLDNGDNEFDIIEIQSEAWANEGWGCVFEVAEDGGDALPKIAEVFRIGKCTRCTRAKENHRSTQFTMSMFNLLSFSYDL